MQYTEEERQCYDSLTNQGKWVCFGNDRESIKRFVSKVMGKDYHFNVETKKSIFGTANVVTPLNK